MNLKLVLICAVCFVEVKTECGDYLTCLSELIHGFFGTKPGNSTVINQTNDTDLYKIKDFSDKHLDSILSQLSSIVKNNVTGDIIDAKTKTSEFMNDKTKVLIKVFDFGIPKLESDISKKSVTTEENITTEKEQIFVTLPTTETREKYSSTDNVLDSYLTRDINTPEQYSSTDNVKNSYLTTDIKTSEQYSSTENVKSYLTTDIIYQVNNMAVSFDNFEDNLIVPEHYLDIGENNTDYPNIDYIELYKDATLENVEFNPTPIADIENDQTDKDIDNNLIEYAAAEEKHANILNKNGSGIPAAVFPWIATIFIKNDSKENQFEYYCDGAILNHRFVLTAGRCININNVAVMADNLLVVLGKKSLHSSGDDERVHKVKTIKIHENFTITGDGAENDLAVLDLDEPTHVGGSIQPARLIEDVSDVENAATTAWGFTGELTEIIFDKEASRKCQKSGSENTFCATYGNDVALCPSYGGVHVVKQTDKWYLSGIRTGDPERRGICLNRDVTYTELGQYKDWIDSVIG